MNLKSHLCSHRSTDFGYPQWTTWFTSRLKRMKEKDRELPKARGIIVERSKRKWNGYQLRKLKMKMKTKEFEANERKWWNALEFGFYRLKIKFVPSKSPPSHGWGCLIPSATEHNLSHPNCIDPMIRRWIVFPPTLQMSFLKRQWSHNNLLLLMVAIPQW